MENKILEQAYAEQFSKCVTYTKTCLLIEPPVNKTTIKRNIETARESYKKIKDKSEISVFSLIGLNQLEKAFGMEITK